MGMIETKSSTESWTVAAAKITTLTQQNKIVWKQANAQIGFSHYVSTFENNKMTLIVSPSEKLSSRPNPLGEWRGPFDVYDRVRAVSEAAERESERISLSVVSSSGESFTFPKISALKGLVLVVEEQLVNRLAPFFEALNQA